MEEYLEMLQDTSELIAKDRIKRLGETVTAFNESVNLSNEVEFWKWLGANYPKDLSDTGLIQQVAEEKGRWLSTQLQGKGYEWDYMVNQRMKPSKVLSAFEAGNCPTQPGIDITERGLINNKVKRTYQNKAYLSSNNPDLHNTPRDAIVVTNKEKVAYAKKQGYITEEYMDSKEIQSIRTKRMDKARRGQACTSYNLENVAITTVKAGLIGAVIGITTETIMLYRQWKSGEVTDAKYVDEIMKSGGEVGVTAGITSAAMIPVQSTLTTIGASALLSIPITYIFGKVINSIIAPCFGKGKYQRILNEAKYYQSLEKVYDDFLDIIEVSARQYYHYIFDIQMQNQKYRMLKGINKDIDEQLEDVFKSI